jgi:hypothetical protein
MVKMKDLYIHEVMEHKVSKMAVNAALYYL